jgi:hypothetical protein
LRWRPHMAVNVAVGRGKARARGNWVGDERAGSCAVDVGALATVSFRLERILWGVAEFPVI